MMTDFVEAAHELSTAELLERIVNSSKYREMLQEEGTEESESRIENIRELLTAAAESAERGESLRDFLDHAALVSDQDSYDEKAPITLMTLSPNSPRVSTEYSPLGILLPSRTRTTPDTFA